MEYKVSLIWSKNEEKSSLLLPIKDKKLLFNYSPLSKGLQYVIVSVIVYILISSVTFRVTKHDIISQKSFR